MRYTRAMVMRRFARTLKRHRHAVGLSQAALARKAGLAQPFVVQLEGGQREPSLTTVWRLAQALGVKPGALLD